MEYYSKGGRDKRTWSWWTLAHQRGWVPPHRGSRQEGTNTPSWPGRIERDIFLQSFSILIDVPGRRWSGSGRWSSTWASPPARPGTPPGSRCGTTRDWKSYFLSSLLERVFISMWAQNLTVVGHISIVAVRSPIAGELVNNILADTAIKERLFTNVMKIKSKHEIKKVSRIFSQQYKYSAPVGVRH